MVHTLKRSHKQYPSLLKEIPQPPKQLYVCGSLRDDLPLVAVVGSRKPTRYGREITERLCFDLATAGVGVVSGLAYGIDAIAHRATLTAGGYTIAVMASGLDRVYPAANRELALQIIKQKGALVSEYESGIPPLKQHFPARNRIVAGLCLGVVVTEANERSGSLITANFALDTNREVMAVPGNITNPLSHGTNALIREGAGMVTSADEVLTALGLERVSTASDLSNDNNPDETLILKFLAEGSMDSSKLMQQSGLDVARFNQTLTLLEISGKIKRLSNGRIYRP